MSAPEGREADAALASAVYLLAAMLDDLGMQLQLDNQVSTAVRAKAGLVRRGCEQARSLAAPLLPAAPPGAGTHE